MLSRVNAEIHEGIRAELRRAGGSGKRSLNCEREEAFWSWDNLGFLGRSLPAELESLDSCWYGLILLARQLSVCLIKEKMGRTSGK